MTDLAALLDVVVDQLVDAARDGCYCRPYSKPCQEHLMYQGGAADLAAVLAPALEDKPADVVKDALAALAEDARAG